MESYERMVCLYATCWSWWLFLGCVDFIKPPVGCSGGAALRCRAATPLDPTVSVKTRVGVQNLPLRVHASRQWHPWRLYEVEGVTSSYEMWKLVAVILGLSQRIRADKEMT